MKKVLIVIGMLISLNVAGQQGWEAQNSGTTKYLTSLHFVDSLTGWTGGVGGTILKTINGGNTWKTQISGATAPVYSIFFINAQEGWAVTSSLNNIDGDNGKHRILHTINGGSNWTVQHLDSTTMGYRSVFFTDPQNGWACGHNVIKHTINGGQTWQTQSIGDSISSFSSLYFIDAQTGWAAGGSPHGPIGTAAASIFKTTDGGTTWLNQYTGTIYPVGLRDIFFLSAQNGWAVGTGGTLLNTIDGGTTWILQGEWDEYNLNGIAFSDTNTGWIVGDGGDIFHTTNAGIVWELQSHVSNYQLWNICMPNSKNGWAVGNQGKIFHTTTGGITPVNKTLVSSPSFSLYPNPAEEWVALYPPGPILATTTTDAMGRTVETPFMASPNQNRLDISALQPGLYWIKLRTNDGMAVQKFIKR